MSPRTPSLLRWLRVAVAALALFGGEGVHELLHHEDWTARAIDAPASGQLEVHAGDCQHHQAAHEPHCHACLLCKSAQVHDLLLPDLCIAWASAGAIDICSAATTVRAPLEGLPGTLGARGPPLTAV